MPDEPIWLPTQVVIDFNKDAVAATGENFALLYADRLDSALMRPRNKFFYEDVYDVITLSVSYMFGIAGAHAFEQGNKRTGFLAGIQFLYDNGFDYVAPDNKQLARDFTRVVAGDASAESFEDILAPHVVPSGD